MLEQKLKIDQKEYIIRSADWNSEILLEAAAQLEEGILYYKKTKDETSAIVLAALAFAYDSIAKSKIGKSEEELRKILQKITKHISNQQEII
jgi:hypothetical protein